VGLRPADALRGDRTHRGAGGRARHRQRVRVPQGAHHQGDQGHLRGASHLRIAHSPGQDVQGRGGRGRALRRGDQRGAQGAGRGGGRTSSNSTSRPAAMSRARRWPASTTWPRKG
jgi:hypothetical protein